jgi:hypothetical protein
MNLRLTPKISLVGLIMLNQIWVKLIGPNINFSSCFCLCSYLFPLQHLYVVGVKRGLIIGEENSLGLDCGRNNEPYGK